MISTIERQFGLYQVTARLLTSRKGANTIFVITDPVHLYCAAISRTIEETYVDRLTFDCANL